MMQANLEQQFLPAVLEIQETPPSPLGRSVLWLIVIFFICTLIWAILGKVNIVAVASGKIIPNGHNKIIQPLGIGAVTAIYVTEGQKVEKGAILIELDASAVNAEITQLTTDYRFTEQQFKRLKWLTAQRDKQHETPNPWKDPVLRSQWQEYRDRLNTLQSEKNKRQAEYRAAVQQAEKLAAILPIITQRSNNEKILTDKKLFPKQQFLETEQQRLSAFYDLESQKNHVQELQQTLLEIDAQIRHTRSDFTKTQMEEREETERKLENIKQDLLKARNRQKALRMISPINGIVQQLAVYTVGAIVTPAQVLMVIVPQNAPLEIEAYIENKDIGFVKEGQSAMIKLDAFPYTKYGTLDGSIVNLSNDAITDKAKGLIYKARVSLKQTLIQLDKKAVQLEAGMAATVEIKTGRRRLIEYFLAPLLKYRSESIHER